MIKINETFLGPDILVCEKCGKVDIHYIIRPNKHIYEICDRCGHEEDKGLVNVPNLKTLGFNIMKKGGKR